MKSIKEWFSSKKEEPVMTEEEQKAKNPANLNTRVNQVKDLNKRKRQMLEELDK